MNTIEIARRFGALGAVEDALKAYALALQNGAEQEERLEAALYILQNGGNYQISYTVLLELYGEGFCREDIFAVLRQAFYEPNIRQLKARYERNTKLLAKYPYLFRRDFPAFEELPIEFFPYNDNGYVPFSKTNARFDGFVNVKEPVISRNFFKDLEKPILAADVFSQYELEYLNDNVRRSEDAARENHIYLHYRDWGVFCAWLQVLNMRTLLENKKFVFLIEDEIGQYPIDFKERFGIDYSQLPLQPFRIEEVSRLIWHAQLSTHNGGDFFNEVFDAHPNLLALPSIMFFEIEEKIAETRAALKHVRTVQDIFRIFENLRNEPRLAEELFRMRNPSDKDLMVVIFLCQKEFTGFIDKQSRIAPAVFFQPHFYNIEYDMHAAEDGRTVLEAEHLDKIQSSSLFKSFKYVKTFLPMRRFTTSHAATVRFMYSMSQLTDEQIKSYNVRLSGPKDAIVVGDAVMERVLNRSFMADPGDRLFRDSVIVRFEDGKLNAKATFSALAAFLDLPYTESMETCTQNGKPFDIGFDPATVYRTYDEYANDSERYYIEYFLRDAYERYGYDFHYYDGASMDRGKLAELVQGFTTMDHYIRESWRKIYRRATVTRDDGGEVEPETQETMQDRFLEDHIKALGEHRRRCTDILAEGLRFVTKDGQPLRMLPMLTPDPALLEQPLYH